MVQMGVDGNHHHIGFDGTKFGGALNRHLFDVKRHEDTSTCCPQKDVPSDVAASRLRWPNKSPGTAWNFCHKAVYRPLDLEILDDPCILLDANVLPG